MSNDTAGDKCERLKTGEYCRSPLACSGFGYCRELNHDGRGMTEWAVEQRRMEAKCALKS